MLLGILLLVAGCSALPPRPPEGYDPAVVVGAARGQLGAPYRYGGADPHGFDCSGLVYFSFRSAGKDVPRGIAELYAAAQPVEFKAGRPGDLVFFRLDGPRLSHVGIYLGDGLFVHAPSTGKRVGIASLDQPFWSQRFVELRRL